MLNFNKIIEMLEKEFTYTERGTLFKVWHTLKSLFTGYRRAVTNEKNSQTNILRQKISDLKKNQNIDPYIKTLNILAAIKYAYWHVYKERILAGEPVYAKSNISNRKEIIDVKECNVGSFEKQLVNSLLRIRKLLIISNKHPQQAGERFFTIPLNDKDIPTENPATELSQVADLKESENTPEFPQSKDLIRVIEITMAQFIKGLSTENKLSIFNTPDIFALDIESDLFIIIGNGRASPDFSEEIAPSWQKLFENGKNNDFLQFITRSNFDSDKENLSLSELSGPCDTSGSEAAGDSFSTYVSLLTDLKVTELKATLQESTYDIPASSSPTATIFTPSSPTSSSTTPPIPQPHALMRQTPM